MSPSHASILKASLPLDPRIVPDRRRYKRFAIALLGRFMRANKQEFPCRLNDISVGGAAIMAPVEVELGERIVAYFDEIGGIEGHVARQFEGGFAISLKCTQHKREKLSAQITWLVNKDELGGSSARRHKRLDVTNKSSTLKLADGSSVSCTVLDVSLSGASIATGQRPPIGSEVHFGKLRCRVMRYHDRGIGVQFLDIPDPEALRRYFG
jgi:c-di-GMP-binding flagellar brake protein YcgR